MRWKDANQSSENQTGGAQQYFQVSVFQFNLQSIEAEEISLPLEDAIARGAPFGVAGEPEESMGYKTSA